MFAFHSFFVKLQPTFLPIFAYILAETLLRLFFRSSNFDALNFKKRTRVRRDRNCWR